MAPPSVWLARLSVSHRRAADSRCTVVNPLPGATEDTERRQAPLRLATFGGCFTRQALIAAHSNAKTIGLHDRRNDDTSVGEVGRIGISGTFRVGYHIMSHMRGLLAAGLSVALVCVSAQQRTAPRASKTAAPAPPKAGAVSGRVFAITEGGDIKPGRMAKIYLFYLQRSAKSAGGNEEEKDSAGLAWLAEQSKALKERAKELREDTEELKNKMLSGEISAETVESRRLSDSVDCLKGLAAYRDAVVGTLTWGKEHPTKIGQILYADADEEGNFKIPAQPGMYLLFASGRAGFNEAFWEAEITVEPGTETTVKLASPKEACLVVR